MKFLKYYLSLAFAIISFANIYSQGTNCNSADPFCTGTTEIFPNSTSTASLGSINCCLTTPNPAWYFLELATGGNNTIQIEQTNTAGSGIDVDFVLFGPYASLGAACASIPGGPVEDCSYSTAAIENADITGGVAGEVYVLLLTNFADQTGTIEFTDVGGAAQTDCSILNPCDITGLTATPTACNATTNQYSVSGTVTYIDPPTSGTLTITSSCGGSQTYNAPFTSPDPYTFSGLTSNGANCTITATFSADPTCTMTTTYTAPASCLCDITGLTATPTACNTTTNQYSVSGNVTYINPPTTGTLTISSSCGGTQTYNAPFTSPDPYNFTGLNSNGAPCTVTATFSANPACNMTANYIAPAACTTSCLITFFNANISAPTCGSVGGTYGITGTINTSGAPTTGTLTVSSTCGATQVFNAPFAASINYSLTGLNADGSPCVVSAVYSAVPSCVANIPYTAPDCPCNMDNMFVNIGACDGPTNTFEVTVDLDFSSAPSTGFLQVDVCGVTQTLAMPASSPVTFTFTGLPADGSNCTANAFFTADPTCGNSLNFTAPADCSCPADAGTFTSTLTGSGNTNFVLCENDEIDITANGDHTYPNDLSDPFTAYNPGIWILIYACPPTPGMDILSDPCFLGVSPFTDDNGNMNDINDLLIINSFPAGTFTDNTVYYVPITMYDVTTGIYSLYPPPNLCFDLGTPVAVTYLPPMTATGIENCAAGTATITVNGGHPELFGTQFTASNLTPATASFVNTTCGDGGTITISGLQNGDMYSFDIVDQNGCPITFTDGPFVGPVTAVIGPSGPFCLGDAAAIVPTTIPGGTWSATCGACINATTGSFNPTTAGVGSHTITYTPPGCSLPSTLVINVAASFDATITAIPAVCESAAPVTFTAVDGGGTWSATCGACINSTTGAFDPAVSGPGTFTITYTIAGGCGDTDTETFTVNPDADASFTVTTPMCATDPAVTFTPTQPGGTWSATCGACINAATGSFNPSVAGIGTFTITYSIAGACPASATNTVDVADLTIISIDTTGTSCFGATDGTITINAPGASQFSIDGGATFQASNVFTVAAGTYNIEVQSTGGCVATGTATIDQPTAIAISAGVINPETCFGACDADLAALPSGGTSPYTVTWTGPSTGTGLSLTNVCSGTYTATLVDDNGCTTNATATVTPAVAISIISITETDASCNGFADGSIVIVGSATVNQYSIDGGTTFQASGTFNSLPAGTYNIVVRDANGCIATGIAVINEPAPLTVTASADVTICIGQNTTLTANGSGGTAPYTITWSPATNLSSTTGSPVTANPTTTQVYNVTITDANTCPGGSDIVIVTVNPPLSVTALSDATICPGSSAPISAIATGGNGTYNYTWTNNQDGTILTGANQNVSPTVTTVYTVTVNDGCGTPSATSSVTISQYVLPAVTFTPANSVGCSPVSVDFLNTTGPSSGSCLWDFGDGTFSTVCDPSHVYTTPGCYDVSLTVTTTDGCVVDTSIANVVCVYANPVADFTWSPNPASVFDPQIQFTNLTVGGASYIWNFDSLGTSTLTNPGFLFPNDSGAVYNVCLQTLSTNLCFDSVCHNIVVLDEFLLYVPNAFTPDGDGMNDIFLPILQGEDPLSYELMIFNRWGELIFQSNNKVIGWDGTHKGIKSKEDVYVWKVRVKKKINEDKIERIGHVTLLR